MQETTKNTIYTGAISNLYLNYQFLISIKLFKVNFFTKSLWNKVKKQTERNDKNYSLNGFLKWQYLDSNAKTRAAALNVLKLL